LNISNPELGQYLELFGNDRASLKRLAPLLSARLSRGESGHDVVRLYATGGVGAKDLRTGATVPRFKDVVAGKLHPLLEGWRKAQRSRVLQAQRTH
jgi:hypothetical protein